MLLNDKPAKFLLALSKERKSVHEIGREFYSCNNSVYSALDRFSQWGLIEVDRGKKELKVKITAKGKEIISHISALVPY